MVVQIDGDEVQGLSLGKFNLQKSVVKEISAEDLKKQRQCKEKQENVVPWGKEGERNESGVDGRGIG